MFSSLLPIPKVIGKQIPKSNRTQKNDPTKLMLTDSSSSSSTTIVHQPSDSKSSNVIKTLHLTNGSLDYSKTIALASSSTRSVQSSYEDTIPLKVRFPHLKHFFPKPTKEEIDECVADTAETIQKILSESLGVDKNQKKDEVSYVNYESKSIVGDVGDSDEVEGSGGRGRVLQIRNFQEDPMLPPKFKLRKNRHKDPSPPPPILKKNSSGGAPLTKEDKEKWNIPSAISNWKNNQGFTISLDKRMAANDQSQEGDLGLNVEKFGNLSQALEDADKKAREEITIRNELMRELAIKEQKEKEEKLRELAEASRRERYKRPSNESSNQSAKRRF
ncbi:pre-mRNA-processing protein 45 [[Candida] railenensis]|uniref:Pre-mRNA-processing protein 45 n=1 Tax=[Candida] railenensis TaxID=45579 RepID=A0A9P0VWI0_9ASCO|nr:pre-mRNA-processing protein 45 [[Candida] railenensis]